MLLEKNAHSFVFHMFRNIPSLKSHERFATSQGFHGHDAKIFFLRKNQTLAVQIIFFQFIIIHSTQKLNGWSGHFFESFHFWTPTNDFECQSQFIEGLDGYVMSLVSNESAYHQKIWFVFLHTTNDWRKSFRVNWRMNHQRFFAIIFANAIGHKIGIGHEHVHAVSTDLVPKPNVVHGKRNDAFDKTREIKVARIFLTIIPSIAHRGVHIANVQSLGPSDDAFGITG